MTTTADLSYARLGLTRGASRHLIRREYFRLAILHHPDKQQGASVDTTAFDQIKQAYETLLRHPIAEADRASAVREAALNLEIEAAQAEHAVLEAKRHRRERGVLF